MASISFVHNGRTFTMTVTEKSGSVDVENNESKVDWSITISGGGGYYNDSYCKAIVNGTTVFNKTKGWSTGEFPAKDGTVSGTTAAIKHDDEGKKTISFSMEGYSFEYTVYSRSGTLALSDIPRASVPTVKNTSGTLISQSNLGTGIRIYSNRYSSSFTHVYRILDGSTAVETLTPTSSQETNGYIPWTPSLANYASRITSGDSKVFTVECTTKNGTTTIGVKTTTITLVVPTSTKPTATLTITEGNSTVAGLNLGNYVYVQGKSKLNVTVSGTQAYSAPITAYSSTIENVTNSTNSYTSNVLSNTGSADATAFVTDSRAHTSNTVTQSYTVLAYTGPAITTAVCERSDSSGNPKDNGTYLKYSFVGSITALNNKNAKTFKIGYKLKTASTYTYVTVVNNAYTVNKSGQVLSGVTLSASSSYDIVFVAEDSFGSTTISKDLGTEFDLLHFHSSGKSMAIGKKSEAGANDQKLEIGLDTYFVKNIYLNGTKIFWSS